MRTLSAPTEDFIKGERTSLGADVSAGASNVAVTVLNNTNLSQNDYIVIGLEGSEQAELVQINAAVTAGTAIQVDALKFNHKKGEPVVLYKYNQRKFYGSTSADGTFTELAAGATDLEIQVDNPQGTISEYTGSTYTYFKATYYNSTTSLETDISDSEAVLADDTARYCSLYAIRVQAGITKNPFITDGRVESKRQQAESLINSYIFSVYVLPLAEIPGIITRICELLAAGWIDFEEYGPEGQGVKWLGEARSMLKMLNSGELVLIGADGTELERQTGTDGVSSYPDSVDNNNGPLRYFTMGQKF